MSNCIASYANRVNDSNGKQILLGIYKGDQVMYNIEIYNGELRQFYAKHNSPAPAKDQEKILDFLAVKKIVKEDPFKDYRIETGINHIDINIELDHAAGRND